MCFDLFISISVNFNLELLHKRNNDDIPGTLNVNELRHIFGCKRKGFFFKLTKNLPATKFE